MVIRKALLQLMFKLMLLVQKQQTLAGSEFHRNGADTNEEK